MDTMDHETDRPTTTRGWRRRAGVAGATTAAGVMLLGAVAWACTQRVGTMLVCAPPSQTYVAGCGKVTGTSQNGTPSFSMNGTRFSVKAVNFKSKNYRVTFRKVNSTQDCHRANAANPDTVIMTATDGTSKFMGPNFYKKFDSPVQSATGLAKVCSQDVPDVVTGQVMDVAVI